MHISSESKPAKSLAFAPVREDLLDLLSARADALAAHLERPVTTATMKSLHRLS